MAKYTQELWEIIEDGVNLFDFNYNLWDITKKSELQNNFIEHFKFHEIGSETIQRFKDRLKCRWLETIDKYSILFEANERLNNEVDVLSNVNTETTIIFNDSPKGVETFDKNHATNYTKTKSKGYAGTTGIELLKNYNENFIDVQEKFFNEFNSLFMQIF